MDEKNKESKDTEEEYELTEDDELCLSISAYAGMFSILFAGCFFIYTDMYTAPDFEYQLYMTESYEKELGDPNKIDCFRKGLPEYYEIKTIGDLKDVYHDKYMVCK